MNFLFLTMNLIVLKSLFFTCIPVGIFLLIAGIKKVRMMFNMDILAEIRLSDHCEKFEIPKSGIYAIWIKAPAYQKNHLDKVKIKIYDEDRKEYKKLRNILFQPSSVNLSGIGKAKIFTFKAEKGNYKAELEKSSSIFLFKKLATNLPLKEADLQNCFFQIRENKSFFYGLFSVLMIVIGVGISIAGFVLGLLTEKLWG
ncbi:MAG: hypothetical protein FWF52_02675 [Candidatus Azobacteroides sp.]|nr:hypothetical protein [Candidatus Azobacteroides sp.]